MSFISQQINNVIVNWDGYDKNELLNDILFQNQS